jgi:hypothetical protein
MCSLRDSFSGSLNTEDAVGLKDNGQLLNVSIYFAQATVCEMQVALSEDFAV